MKETTVQDIQSVRDRARKNSASAMVTGDIVTAEPELIQSESEEATETTEEK